MFVKKNVSFAFKPFQIYCNIWCDVIEILFNAVLGRDLKTIQHLFMCQLWYFVIENIEVCKKKYFCL